MSVTSTPDCNFDIIESVQFSNGPTSRTTTGQFTMSTTEKLKQFMDDVLEKDEEINRLKEENERLKQENERLKQHKGPDHFLSNRNGDCRIKAIELKKALDDWLGQDHQSRPMRPITAANANVLLPTFSPVTNPHPNVDVNKPSTSANENPKPFRSADEPSTNGTNHHLTHTNFKEPNDYNFGVRYTTQQDFRPQSDIDIVNQATDMQHRHFAPYNNNLPTVANGNNNNANRRFVPPNNNFNGMGGMNNNNNRNRSSHIPHVNHSNSNSNSNNNNNNNNNKQNQYTIFISWPGSMTIEELRELFEPSDIEDIRYTNQKQFAHIDLKSESALNKAMALGGTTKNSKQGELRVERGKPRSTNTAENGQRSQHQNKNFNRQNNKSVNGYPPQKHNNNKYGYNNSNHSGQYSTFVAPEENFTMSSNGSNGLNPSLNQQEHTKQSGDTV